jgi:hypothetical protein
LDQRHVRANGKNPMGLFGASMLVETVRANEIIQ